VFSPAHVYHVGTLDIADRRQSAWDQEGDCLSVSEHPDAWRQIARLGGAGTWVGTPKGARHARFLEALELDDDQFEHIRRWATEQGLIRHEVRWIASIEDDEAECTRELVCDSYEQALDEAFDDPQAVREQTVMVGQEPLRAWSPHAQELAGGRHSMVGDLVVVAYADMAGYDGVWWHEELDPVVLSAPRGGITPSALDGWAFEKV
jgi:hypothetical protein